MSIKDQVQAEKDALNSMGLSINDAVVQYVGFFRVYVNCYDTQFNTEVSVPSLQFSTLAQAKLFGQLLCSGVKTFFIKLKFT